MALRMARISSVGWRCGSAFCHTAPSSTWVAALASSSCDCHLSRQLDKVMGRVELRCWGHLPFGIRIVVDFFIFCGRLPM